MHDFFSDAKTKPSKAMLESVLVAELGDEQLDNDPTTDRLCRRVSELLGKEAAVLLPSGTMCNAIALNVHCEPGDEVICAHSSYLANFEAGGPAALSGVMLRALEGERGMFTSEQLTGAIRAESRFSPRSKLAWVEQTTANGGAVWPLDELVQIACLAGENGLATHLDGARLLNATAASGIPAKQFVEYYDSCWLDFAKCLGAPIGAVLAGSQEFIDKAWRIKQRWGGAMHQSGVIAAMCLYGLDHHIERIQDDHRLAKTIGDTLARFELVEYVMPVDTNMVIVQISSAGPDAKSVVDALKSKSLLVGAIGARRIRIVTHLGVNQAAGDLLVSALETLLNP